MKKGYQTTEFWLSLAAMALTALYASGVLAGTVPLAIAGIAATILGALGYTVSRTGAKKMEMQQTVQVKPVDGGMP